MDCVFYIGEIFRYVVRNRVLGFYKRFFVEGSGLGGVDRLWVL